MSNLTLINYGIPNLSSFEAYKQYVRSIPQITEAEEIALVRKFKEENCIYSAQKLIITQLKTVLHIVHKYNGYGLPAEDLVQEGNIGLMKAVKNFDLKYKVRLYSYALLWIKAEIQTYILKNWKIVKIASTRNLKKLFFNLKSTKKELINLGIPKKELLKNVALKLGVTEQEVRDMDTYFSSDDICIEFEKESNPDFDIQSDTNIALEYEERHDSENLQKKLEQYWHKLTYNQREVLIKRFYGDEKKTHKEIAQDLSISSERVRQIEQEALTKLRKLFQQE